MGYLERKVLVQVSSFWKARDWFGFGIFKECAVGSILKSFERDHFV